MVKGSSVLEEIRCKMSEMERKVSKEDNEISSYEDQITRLGDKREEAYAGLAAIYLPSLNAESVGQTLKAVQSEVRGIFQEKQQRRQKLEATIQSLRDERKKLGGQLDDVSGQLNEKAKERDKLEEEVAKTLSEDKQYTDLHSKAKEAKDMLSANKARVAEVKSESEKKLPLYEGNRMFMYLVGRGFGTRGYEENGMIAKLDRWVAGIVHFDENKRCYDFLRAMPELMAQEVKRRQDDLGKIVKKLSSYESEASEHMGLAEVNRQGDSLLKKRNDLMSKIESKDGELGACSSEREDLDGKKDSYHAKAMQQLKSYLQGQDISDLKERARKTPDARDDRLVDTIEEIGSKMSDLKASAKGARYERDRLSEKLQGLRRIERNFVEKDYDSGRSEFTGGFDINSLLAGYLLGKMESPAVIREIDDAQHFKPRETSYRSSRSYRDDDDGYSGYSGHSGGSSSDWGSSSGGGFGGGGFSSGGGFGGGGFSSGSGF